MSRLIQVHPQDPQDRLIEQVAEVIRQGGVIIYPTDTGYAVGWRMDDKGATDRVRFMRGLDKHHHFTLACKDLSEISNYARIDDPAYRVLRAHTPGPYTFILRATKEVPKRLQHDKRKTIGIRVPDNTIAQALLSALGEPIQTTSVVLPDATELGADPYEIHQTVGNQVDIVVDGGYCGNGVTTIVDLTEGVPVLVREGDGDASAFHREDSLF